MEVIREVDGEKCDCPNECVDPDFQIRLSQSAWPSKQYSVHINKQVCFKVKQDRKSACLNFIHFSFEFKASTNCSGSIDRFPTRNVLCLGTSLGFFHLGYPDCLPLPWMRWHDKIHLFQSAAKIKYGFGKNVSEDNVRQNLLRVIVFFDCLNTHIVEENVKYDRYNH